MDRRVLAVLVWAALPACVFITQEEREAKMRELTTGSLDPMGSFVGSWETGCTARSWDAELFDDFVNVSDVTIIGYRTVGFEDAYRLSRIPEVGAENVITRRVSGACPGTTEPAFPYESTLPSERWFANEHLNTLGACFSEACGVADPDSCSGAYEVRIAPPPSGYSCEDFDPVRVELIKAAPNRETAARDAECAAGSGRFLLVGVNAEDKDGDGRYGATFRPFQLTGTGTMTSSAWITSTAVVSSAGHTLRAIRTGESYQFSDSDLLLSPTTKSVALSGQQSHAAGTIRGNAPFVVEEFLPADSDSFVVDMSWTCGAPAGQVHRGKGYQLSLGAIGCGMVQKLTIRPVFNQGPKRLHIEQYGNPGSSLTVPTQTTVEGEAFTLEHGPLLVNGVWLSSSAQSATVRLDDIWLGDAQTSVCTTGTYTLPQE